MMLLFVLSAYSLGVTVLLGFSLSRNFGLIEKLEEVEETVAASLEVLEAQHQKMDDKTKIEVFSDEPVIRELISDIKEARDSVMKVAQALEDSVAGDEENQPEETETT